MTLWFPGARTGLLIVFPSTLGITVGARPSMIKSTLFVPFAVRQIVAMVPVKENARPVPGQVSSLVEGLTRPR